MVVEKGMLKIKWTDRIMGERRKITFKNLKK
jgi:hypothetical protein